MTRNDCQVRRFPVLFYLKENVVFFLCFRKDRRHEGAIVWSQEEQGNLGNCCCRRCNKGQGQEGLSSFGAEHGATFESEDGIDPAADENIRIAPLLPSGSSKPNIKSTGQFLR